MGWQRKIPFGYQMRQGQILRENTEAEMVKSIFAHYLQGDSLQQIAEAMSQKGVCYHRGTEQWNKHMVKRILENGHYLGDELYPPLIDSDTYLAVHLLKRDKSVYSPCIIAPTVRERIVCGCCGARLERVRKNKKTTQWKCENSTCCFCITINDETVAASVNSLLDALAHDPQPLMAPVPLPSTPEQNSFRIINELTNAFNRGTESPGYIRSLIFAAAAEKYNELPDRSLQYKVDKLRTRLEAGECDKMPRQELLETAVRAIRVTENEISLILVNGQIIGTPGEEAAQE